MRRQQFVIAIATIALGTTFFGLQLRASLAQDAPPAAASNAPTAAAGKAVFEQKCAVCHNADSTDKKIGPGLKGLYARGTFTTSGNKLTDESVTAFIQAGSGMMPPFKGVLEPAALQDVVAYLKTL
jgi:mono/diheme cytochrome c family protein